MNIGNKDLIIELLQVGPIATNCYVVTNVKDKATMIVDPGGSYQKIKDYVDKITAEVGSKVQLIVDTHGHWDHVYCNADAKRDFPEAKLYIHKADEHLLAEDNTKMVRSIVPSKADAYLEEGMTLKLGSLEMPVFHTPGHTEGGVCILLANKYFLVGDTIFKGSIGRTDLPGGSFRDIINSIKTKIMPMDDSLFLLPGHGPTTTVGYERANNMFLQD